MPPDPPLPPGQFRRFFKHVSDGTRNVFKRGDRASPSHTRSPPPQTPPGDLSSQLMSPEETVSVPASRLLVRSQQSTSSPGPATSPSQSALTTSLPVADNHQLAKAESSLVLATKTAGANTWDGLKTALQVLKESSVAFPPLQAAVGGFLAVADVVKETAKNREDYAQLASNLHSMVEGFEKHSGEHMSSKMSAALMAIRNGLKEEIKNVEQQQRRPGYRRILKAGQDMDDIQKCYRCVDTLCRELQHKALIEISSGQEEQKVDARLKDLNATLLAMYDSSFSDVIGRRTCTPGTREAILQEMREWADDPERPKVYWLNGMAGTGKTTLAHSFCAERRSIGRLGASFFCSRGHNQCGDVSRIVPSIAHQLARLLPSYREALIKQIGEDKDIGGRNARAQFEKLIRDPLVQVEADVPNSVVVVIDALDECDQRDVTPEILNMLFLYAKDLPIRFLVTCRPEPALLKVLNAKDEHSRSALDLHDIEASFVQADITEYLKAELAETSLASDKLGMLAEQSGALFIYAATAVRYINPKNREVDVHQRLDDLLSMASKTRADEHKGIDKLYTAVLVAPFADEDLSSKEKKNVRMVLDTAICAREPMSVTTMAELLGLKNERDIVLALQHLRSVLHVSQGTNLISTLHASFPDFMLSRERSKDLCCDAAEHNQHLALCCFSAMHRLLRFNICDLESSFVLDENIPKLTEKINKAISPELFYACRYWSVHLGSAEAGTEVHSALEEFLSNRLLFWMEVLNLMKCIGAGVQVLDEAYNWLQKSGGANDALALALDASRFMTAFGLSVASRSTPHIYVSALPFWPETRPVSLRYQKHMRGLIRLEGSGMDGRDVSCLSVWNVGSSVYCLAFSPDGTRIVSGSQENTISVWDAHSGVLVVGPLEGHTSWVQSVGFSPDGSRIVSGSRDDTIRVWDARSGDLVVDSFEGHTYSVNCVAFSPDGARIVSGSDDLTIRVWDAHSGVLVAGPFQGHTRSVLSAAFSPDSNRIISGSLDKTIRVWDANSGALIAGPFEWQTNVVSSVAFSSDSTRFTSGSGDGAICVWDAQTGNLIAGPFKGHTRFVNCVAFSPDGTRIVSSSFDETIRVWDAYSGDPVAGPFEGHTSWVSHVGFSPDGTRIVSGSVDKTIRVWDAHSGPVVDGPFPGHTNSVKCVAFSPEGNRVVSCSSDKTICIWDANSGDLIVGPFEGHARSINCVAFSSDGTRVVSGSDDDTIRVWDARSGTLVAGPFEGHTYGVNCVAFSPNGTRIASCSLDKTIRVWDASSGALVAGPLRGHIFSVNSVAFSPRGTRIVSGSHDQTIRIWDAYSGDLIAGPFEGHTDEVLSVAFSPDGARIVSGSLDKTVRVWDSHSGLLTAVPFEGHTRKVHSVAFSPDGAHIVSGSHDKTIRIWDARSGDLVAGPFEWHTSWVNSVAFSPDGSLIASGSHDRAIRICASTSLRAREPGHLGDWQMDETGMIVTQQQQLLLCVPVNLRTGVVWPQNIVCIFAKGVLNLDFDNVLLGNQWMECYQFR